MAWISKKDNQYRVRYNLYLPDGSIKDRSRLTQKLGQGREVRSLAEIMEGKTKRQDYSKEDIDHWIRAEIITKSDADLLQSYKDGRKSLQQAADEYLATLDCCKKEKDERERRINRIIDILGREYSIQEVRFSDGEKIKSILRERGYKAVTVNKHVQDLKRMFTLQLAEQVIEHHPFGVTKGVKVPKDEKIEHTVLTHEQISEVLNEAEKSDSKNKVGDPPALGGNLTLFLLMFFGCGLRRKEALSARLENIDWEKRCLRITETKNGEERTVGLGKRLYEHLLAQKNKKGYILPRYYPNSVSRSISRHFKRCGFEMRLHDTRHTYTTRLLDLGVLKHLAQQRTGHKDSRMLDHYSHPGFGEVFEDDFDFMKTESGTQKEKATFTKLRLLKSR